MIDAEKYAHEKLNGELLEHTRGCARMSKELALAFGVDPDKAETASYLHDIAKRFSKEEQIEMAKHMGMNDEEINSFPLPVLHGPLAALIARDELKIEDPEILNAIECHSTGCAGLGDLGKVLFVADYIEPTRDFPGAAELRAQMGSTLDELTAAVCREKLLHLIEQDMIIDLRAIAMWNDLREQKV